MADYPVSKIDIEGSRESWADPVQIRVARDNSAKGKRLGTGKKKIFAVAHKYLTAAERTALESHYDAHRNTTFNLLWPATGATHSVLYIDEEISFSPLKGGQWSTVLRLREA